nr:MAG TPA: hypothetical protein [Caudoviricetes sp.]
MLSYHAIVNDTLDHFHLNRKYTTNNNYSYR